MDWREVSSSNFDVYNSENAGHQVTKTAGRTEPEKKMGIRNFLYGLERLEEFRQKRIEP